MDQVINLEIAIVDSFISYMDKNTRVYTAWQSIKEKLTSTNRPMNAIAILHRLVDHSDTGKSLSPIHPIVIDAREVLQRHQ